MNRGKVGQVELIEVSEITDCNTRDVHESILQLVGLAPQC